MKSNFFLLVSAFCVTAVYAQETLVTVRGKRIEGRLRNTGNNQVSFIKTDKTVIQENPDKIAYVLNADGTRKFLRPTIHLYNGKNIAFRQIRQDDRFLYYTPLKKDKECKLKTDKVFSYHTSEKEVLLFRERIYEGDTLTESKIRSMVEGRQDARLFYKNPYTGVANFTLGFISGGLMNYWGIFVPAVYTGVYSAINPLKTKKKTELLGPRFLEDEYYRYGFNSRAKINKLKWSAGGGALGIITSVGILEYLKKFRPDIIDKIW
jgi:hypothetical protein